MTAAAVSVVVVALVLNKNVLSNTSHSSDISGVSQLLLNNIDYSIICGHHFLPPTSLHNTFHFLHFFNLPL